MVRKLVFILLFVAFAAMPSHAQIAEQDTICVPVVQLKQTRQDIEDLRRRDSVNTEIKKNLRAQVRTLETTVKQDSVIIGSLERELGFRKQQIEFRDHRIDNLQTQLRRQEVRKWVYFAGGAATVVLGAWVSGKAAN